MNNTQGWVLLQISHWANPNWKGHDMCGNKIQDIFVGK